MRISVKDAEGQLSDLVRLVNQGEEIVLMEDGQPVVRLENVRKPYNTEEKKALLDRLRSEVKARNLPSGPDAAHSQDFLYDEFGLPK